jgi:hypothetical protein
VQLLNGELVLNARPAVERGADQGHQLPVLGLGLEIPATTLDKLLLQPPLPVPVRAFNGAVLDVTPFAAPVLMRASGLIRPPSIAG